MPLDTPRSPARPPATPPATPPVTPPVTPTVTSPYTTSGSGPVTRRPARRARPSPGPQAGFHRPRGFTLVEAAVVVAVLAVLSTLATPSLQALVDRWRLAGAATALGADLQFARFEAIVRQEAVRVSALGDGAGGHCIAVHSGPTAACECSATTAAAVVCTGAAQLLRHVHLPADARVRLASPPVSLQFDPQLGTCTPAGSFALRTAAGDAVHQVVNVMGRVRACSPDGKVAGHVPC